MSKKTNKPKSKRAVVETLESRILFSADFLSAALPQNTNDFNDITEEDQANWTPFDTGDRTRTPVANDALHQFESTSKSSAPDSLPDDQTTQAPLSAQNTPPTKIAESPQSDGSAQANGRELSTFSHDGTANQPEQNDPSASDAPGNANDLHDDETNPGPEHLNHHVEYVFVDPAVENSDILLSNLRDSGEAGIEWRIVVLDDHTDGVDQITEVLVEVSGVNAIHLISHGQESGIMLGSTILNTSTVDEYTADVWAWGQSLEENADLLIYGCDLAGTQAGKDLIELLAQECGCDVAASDDLTGHKDLGGDWDLEYKSGDINTDVAFDRTAQQAWLGTLDFTSNLVIRQNFDTDAQDSSGNNHHGTLMSPANIDNTPATNQIGDGKVSLNGAGAYVNMTSHVSAIEPLTEGTISLWVNRDTSPKSVLFEATDLTDADSRVALIAHADGSLGYFVNEGAGPALLDVRTAPAVIPLNTWTHVAVTVSATGNKLFVNGTEVAAPTYSNGNTATSEFFSSVSNLNFVAWGVDIYSSVSPREYFDGFMDDGRVYSRALTPADITDLYNYSVQVNDLPPVDLNTNSTTSPGLTINNDGGNDAYLIADDGNAILGGLSSFSFETQFTTASPGDELTLLSYATAAKANEIVISINADGSLSTFLDGTSFVSSAFDYNSLRDGDKHSIAVTWDNTAGELNIYVDGVVVDTVTGVATGTLIGANGILIFGQEQNTLGGSFDPLQTFKGTYHNIRLFSDVRTDAEIANSYNDSLPHSESGLLAQWNFDKLSKNNTIEDSVNSNNLLIKHTAEAGFSSSKPELTLTISENSPVGTIVGSVVASDQNRNQLITDILATDSNLYYSELSGKFYQYVNTDMTRADANTNALTATLNGVSGKLAAIQSADQNQLLVNILTSKGATEAYISASDAAEEGEWRWGDQLTDQQFWQGDGSGSATSGLYSNWDPLLLDDDLTGQDYARLIANTGQWDDVQGTAPAKSFIEYDADIVLDNAGPVGQQPLGYTIVSQSVTGAFAVDTDTGTITVADTLLVDYESTISHLLTIRATDIDGNYTDTAITISISDLLEENNPPIDLTSGIELNSDGGNDTYLISTNGSSVLGGLTELTIESTFSVRDSGPQVILSYSTSTYNDALQLQLTSGALRLSIADTFIDLAAIDYNATVNDGSPHNLAVSWDNTNGDIQVFLDGEFVESATGLATGLAIDIDATNALVLGMDNDTPTGVFQSLQTFRGTHYDLKIWDESRSEADIALNQTAKIDTTTPPAGLIANWLMDGFNGFNQVEDSIGSLDLSVGHASGAGFTPSVAIEDLNIDENSPNGSSVGFIIPTAAENYQSIVNDGLFTEADSTASFTRYSAGQTAGGWLVESGDVDIHRTIDEISPLGGYSMDLSGAQPGAISQTLATEPGRQYQVTFAFTGYWENAPEVKPFSISIDGQKTDLLAKRPDNWAVDNRLWDQKSITFTADSTSTLLQFSSPVTTGWGPAIADVQVTEIPSSVSTLLSNDPGLSFDAVNGKFYRFVNTPTDFNSALNAATSAQLNHIDGQLATVRSNTENELFQQLAIDSGSSLWLGASDANSEGNWNWLQGSVESTEAFWTGGAAGNHVNEVFSEQMLLSETPTENYLRLQTDGTWADDNAGSSHTYVIEWDATKVLSNYSFTLTDAEGRFEIDANTGEITVKNGSILDYETSQSHTVSVEVTNVVGQTYDEIVTIQVNEVGAELAQTIPIPQVTNEDTPIIFNTANSNAITVTDQGPVDALLQVNLTVNNGTLTLSQTTGLTFVENANGAASMVFEGTESDINTALEGLQYLPDPDYTGSDLLTVTTSLAANMETYYNFDVDASDTSAGPADDGILQNGASIGTDPDRGQVVVLDGINDFVETTADVGQPASATLATWVNANNGNSDVISIDGEFTIRLDDPSVGGYVNAFYHDGTTYRQATSNQAIANTGWHHVAASFDDTSKTLKLYIDGIEVASNTFTDSINYGLQSTNRVYFGTNIGASLYLDGQLDDSRIYSRVLSADEIKTISGRNAPQSIGANLTETFGTPAGDTSAQNHLFIHDGFNTITTDGVISSLQIASDNDNTAVNFDLLVLRPQASGDYEIIHRVPLTDAEVTSTVNGIRTLDIGRLDVRANDVLAHWSLFSAGSIPYTLSTTGSATGWSVYYSASVDTGDYVQASLASTEGRVYGLAADFQPAPQVTDDVELTVLPVNDPPIITTTPGGDTHTEGGPGTWFDNTLTITDADSPDFSGGVMTTTITANGETGDRLSIADGNSIAVSAGNLTYDFGSGPVLIGTVSGGTGINPLVVTFNNSATAASVEAAGQQVSFRTEIDDPSELQRAVTMTVSDGDGATSLAVTRTIDLVAVNDPPILSAIEPATLSYTENTGLIPITASLAVADPDNADINSATVSFTAGYVNTDDSLSFTAQNGITASFDVPSGTLSLTGSATKAHYEAALQSITYSNSSDDPDTGTRTISFVVNDSALDSLDVTRDISITPVNDAPVTASIESSSLQYVENDGALDISDALVVSDVDNDNLASATISISSGFQTGEDVLGFINTGNISAVWYSTSGILTLTGSDSVANYQAALRNITYENTSANPNNTPRLVSFIVNDGIADSSLQTRTIEVTGSNNNPGLSLAGGLNYVENSTPQLIEPSATVSDVDSADFDTGSMTITLTSGASALDRLAIEAIGDAAGQINVNGSNVLFGGVVIGTASGGTTGSTPLTIAFNSSATPTAVQALLRNVTYENLSNAPVTAVNYDITLTDGDTGTTTRSETISITPVNDSPNISSLDGNSLSVENNGSSYFIDVGMDAAINDPENPADLNLGSLTLTGNNFFTGDAITIDTSGTVSLFGGYNNGATIRVSGTDIGVISGITASGLSVSLGSNASVSAVDTLLQSFTFSTSSSTLGLRTVDYTLIDGDGTANGGNDTSTAKVNIFVGDIGSGTVTTDEDTNYTFSASDFEFTGVTGTDLDTITITSLPAIGTLLYNTTPVSIGDSFTRTQINSGMLQFEPIADQNGMPYAVFDFYVNTGKSTVTVLPGYPNSYTLNGGSLPDTDAILANPANFGPNGTVSTDITVGAPSGNTTAAYLADGEIMFNGFVPDGGYSVPELTAINNWVLAGGILVSTSEHHSFDDINDYYNLVTVSTGNTDWEIVNTTNPVINGKFGPVGVVGDIIKAIGSIAHFDVNSLGGSDVVVARDTITFDPTIVLRPHGAGYILFVSDEGIFRANMTGGGVISTTNDRLAANIFAWTADLAAINEFHQLNIDVTPVNDIPVLSAIENTNIPYTENAGAMAITSSISIADIDDVDMESATVSISNNFISTEDQLSFANQNGISGSYNSSTGQLTLTGTASKADYATALHSVTYENTSDNPDTSTRTLTFTVDDGDANSLSQSRDISVSSTNDAPLQTNLETSALSYTEGSGQVAVTSTLLITDPDDTLIESAVVGISGNYNSSEDILSFTNQNGINGVYNAGTGTWTLTGSSTLANYQAALRSITYENTSENPVLVTRAVSFTLNDGLLNSTTVTRNINIGATNDAPVLSSIEPAPNSYTENDSSLPVTSTIVVTDVDDLFIESAQVRISNAFAAGEDYLTFVDQNGISGSYNNATGLLLLTGSAQLGDYQAALRSVGFLNTSDDPGAATRTISYQINDGEVDSNLHVRDITFTAVNDIPVKGSLELTPVVYTENTSPVAITSTLTLNDVDDTHLESASVIIDTNFLSTEDVLSFTDQNGITGSFNSTTGELILSGSSLVANYQAAIRSITYTNTSDDPDATTRNLSITLFDGDDNSVTLSRGITIIPVNDQPVLNGIETSTTTYTENGPPLIITSALTISDIDDTMIDSADVNISANFVAGEDELVFTDHNGIIGSYNTATGQLSLSGTATLAQYQAALHTVSYQNTSDDPDTSIRTILFSVNDGDLDSNSVTRTVSLTAVNDPPSLTAIEGTSLDLTENDGPAAISTTIALGDLDDLLIENARVHITGNFTSTEDVLSFTDQNGISGTYNPVNGEMLLSGTSSKANYESALRSVTYTNTSDDPDTNQRTVSFTINDGDANSNTLVRNITIAAVNDAPVLSSIETTAAAYTENDPDIQLTSAITLSDLDDVFIESATITITGNLVATEDILNFTDQNGITSTFDATTGVLALTGTSSVANYEAAIRSVTYTNTSDNPDNSTRTVTIYINDGDVDSNLATRDITISPVNDASVLSAIESTPAAYTENDLPLPVSSTITLSDIDDTLIESALVAISGNFANGEDILTFTDQNGITGTYAPAAGVMSLVGSATLAQYQSALQSVSYFNSSDNPSVIDRTISYDINDGDIDSNTVTRDINFTPVNDASVLSSIESTPANYTENDPSVQLTASISLSDIDDVLIESASIIITGNFVGTEDLLNFTDQNGISGSYNSSTGELTLTGSSGIASYEAAIRSITYTNTSDNPDIGARTVSVTINDGDVDSNTLTRDINIIPVNDATVLAAIEPAALAYIENAAPQTITSAIALSDVDDLFIESASIQITNNLVGTEDVLGFIDQNGISGTYNSVTGEMILSGTSTVANYEAAIRSVTYTNTSDNPDINTRTVSFTINDGDIDSNITSRDITISPINDAPVLSAIESAPAAYTENDLPLPVSSMITISELDDTLIESAVVAISGNFANGEDILTFTNQNGITGTFNAATGELTLTGSSGIASYEAAIRSITYTNTNDNPDVSTRTVSFTINDGDIDSNLTSRDITISPVNDAPVLSAIESTPATYTENDLPLPVSSTITISELDDTLIESAVVAISGNFANGEDILTLTNQNGITGTYDPATGVMSLLGSATLAQYQSALQSVSYFNSSDNPSFLDRTISYTINDGDIDSNTLSRDISFTPVNDASVLASIESTPANYTENATSVQLTAAISLSDIDDVLIESASVMITGNFVGTEDVLNFTDQNGITGTFNAATGELTLTGSSSIASYEAAIRSITYTNTSDDPDNSPRTVTVTINDGDVDSNTLFRDINIIPVNDASVLAAIEPAALAYIENAAPQIITSTITLIDVDDLFIESASIQITNNLVTTEDVLGFTDQNGITGTYDTATGVMLLTGTGSMANYEAAIRNVTYFNSSDDPDTNTRTVTITVNDGDIDSSTVTRDIMLAPVNDPPVLGSIEPAPAVYTENDPTVQLTSSISLSDLDDVLLESASIMITGNFTAAEDVLNFTDQNGITGNFNTTTGELTLIGSSSVADYEAAIQSITYANTSDDPFTGDRIFRVTVNDGDADSNSLTRNISIVPVNDAPVLSTIESNVLSYIENDSPTPLTSNLTVSDLDNNHIHNATVQISGNYRPLEDIITFVNQNGIVGSYDSATGTINLSGSATLIDYQDALRSITYENTSDDPDTSTRTIDFTINDGTADSNSQSRDIEITPVNDAPVESNIETAALNVIENSAPLAITSTLTLSELDDTNLESATVSISGNYIAGEDLLAFTDQNGITGDFNSVTGALTLHGSATVANYESALRTITYTNLSDDPDSSNRVVTFTVNDGDVNSNTLPRTITISPVNDAPVIQSVESAALSVSENDAPALLSQTISLSDLDNTTLQSATVAISGNYAAGEDILSAANQNGIVVTFDNSAGVLTLSGTASVADYETALRSISYTNTSENPSTSTRSVTYSVNDGLADSNVKVRLVDITRVNDPAVQYNIEGASLAYTENGLPINITSSITLTDVDNTSLQSATVRLGSTYVAGEDLLSFVDTPTLTSSWDAATGILTITGADTFAAYQDALRTITYFNTSDNPDTTNRQVYFTVHDGGADSNILSRHISITALNDAPVEVAIETTPLLVTENSVPLTITDSIFLNELDDINLEMAVVQITTGYQPDQDVLSFSNTVNITAAWNSGSGELILTGTDTIAAYQDAIRSITYANTSDDPIASGRTISLTVNDGDANSNTVSREVGVIPVNDAPVTSLIQTLNLSYIENADPQIVSSTITLSDLDDTQLESAVVAISTGYSPGEDILAFTDTAAISGSWDANSGTLTLTGTDTISAYQSALQTVTYFNTSDNPDLTQREVSFTVDDGNAESNLSVRNVIIIPVNDLPSGAANTVTMLEDSSYLFSMADFGFTDVLDNHQFTAITVNQLPATGQLQLNGIPVTGGQLIAVADINAGLLAFTSVEDENGLSYDTFTFRVIDDGGTSNGGSDTSVLNTMTIDVVNVNDAPDGGDNTVLTLEDTDHIFQRPDFLFTDVLDNDEFSAITISALPNTGLLTLSGNTVLVGQVISTAQIDSGLLIYTPPIDETGVGYNGFAFQVHDNGGNSFGGISIDPTANFISFNVPGVNDAPLLIAEGATVDEGSSNLIGTDVLSGTDADDLLPEELTFTLTLPPLNGELRLNGDLLESGDSFTLTEIAEESLRYIHDGSETDADQFYVSLADGGEDGVLPAAGRFSLIINEVIDPAPVLDNDELFLQFGQEFDSLEGDLLASGSNSLSSGNLLDNTAFTVEVVVPPQHGVVEVNPDGTFTYIHDGSVFLEDEFSYRVTNEDGVFTIATVAISVEPAIASAFSSNPPTAAPGNIVAEEAEEVAATEAPNTETEESAEAEQSSDDIAFETSGNQIDSPTGASTTLELLSIKGIDSAASAARATEAHETIVVEQHNAIRDTTIADANLSISNLSFEVVFEVVKLRAHDVVANPSFLQGLARLESELEESEEKLGSRYTLANETIFGVSISATAGALAWALRGGALFASVMASTPLWASLDPVRALAPPPGSRNTDEETSEDRSVENIFRSE